MLIDFLMAIAVTILFNLYGLISYKFKNLMIFTSSFTVILFYFFNDFEVSFIGQTDFAIWILYIICLDIIMNHIIKTINNKKDTL